MVFVAFFLLRQLGQGLMMLIASTAMLRYLPEMRGKAAALSSLGYIVAEAILPIAVVAISAFFDWRQTLMAIALALCVSVFFGIPFLLRDYKVKHAEFLRRHHVPDDNQDSSSAEGAHVAASKVQRQWTRTEVLRDARFYLLLPALLAQSLLFTGFIFHQGFIVEAKGWSWQWWVSLFSVYASIAFCTKLIAGVLIDRFSAFSLLPFGLIPLACGLAALALGESIYHAVFFFVGLGITTGIQTTVSGPVIVEFYGDKHIGAIKSVFSSLMVFGTGLTPFIMGVFIDRGFGVATLAWWSVVYIAVAILLVGFIWSRSIYR